jgi:hypothetical protein
MLASSGLPSIFALTRVIWLAVIYCRFQLEADANYEIPEIRVEYTETVVFKQNGVILVQQGL